jgi:AcrR family transcriptional regulator
MANRLSTGERRGRVRREPLTRERVVEAAVRLMDKEGLEALTMRRLGRELGVEAMSLYNHVRDKEDLLDSICEHVLAQFRAADHQDWAEAARIGAREYRRLLKAHPNLVTLMTERKSAFTNPESLRAYEYAFDVFHRAGLDGPEAVKAFHAVGGFILGFVMFELGLAFGDEGHAQAHQDLGRVATSGDLPRLREVVPHFMACDDDESFEFGLSLLIEGLRARASASR